ncbi:MAG: prepilin-type N-terminal cleavage/methylation domain-containing protein [Candidatus Dormibacteraeota bacterium]|nr:prepilin-type N-terminal cleavage/methylation domain-containing protein [Candidatus Dormibacteraeota bacterium]
METLARVLKKRNNQKGFTLIELLVVISILGILAAVVTMSLVGLTEVANKRAGAAELVTVQNAYDTMLADQGVAAVDACPTNAVNAQPGTQDMTLFPVKVQANPPTTNGQVVSLASKYLRGSVVNGQPVSTTHGFYHCTTNGQVVQDSYP